MVIVMHESNVALILNANWYQALGFCSFETKLSMATAVLGNVAKAVNTAYT